MSYSDAFYASSEYFEAEFGSAALSYLGEPYQMFWDMVPAPDKLPLTKYGVFLGMHVSADARRSISRSRKDALQIMTGNVGIAIFGPKTLPRVGERTRKLAEIAQDVFQNKRLPALPRMSFFDCPIIEGRSNLESHYILEIICGFSYAYCK